MKRLTVCALLLWASAASADGVTTLRLATAAPDGTAWARQLKMTSDGIVAASKGALHVKWYFGGIAGDEMETIDRMAKGQLDGIASGGPLCEKIAPTMRVLGIARSLPEPRRSRLRHARAPSRAHRRGAEGRVRAPRHERAGADGAVLAAADPQPRRATRDQALDLEPRSRAAQRHAHHGPQRRPRQSAIGGPVIFGQRHRWLHRRARRGAGVPVVGADKIFHRPALRLSDRVHRHHQPHVRPPPRRAAAHPARRVRPG